MIYKLYKSVPEITEPNAVTTIDSIPSISFLFDNNNQNYKNFKKAINEETAELQDADGNTMTAAEAKEFVATLP